jgi:hypothetical protein
VIVIGTTNRIDAVDPAFAGASTAKSSSARPTSVAMRDFDIHTREMPLARCAHSSTNCVRTHGFRRRPDGACRDAG